MALPEPANKSTAAFFAAPPNPEHKDLQVVTSQQALEKQLSSGPKVTGRSDQFFRQDSNSRLLRNF